MLPRAACTLERDPRDALFLRHGRLAPYSACVFFIFAFQHHRRVPQTCTEIMEKRYTLDKFFALFDPYSSTRKHASNDSAACYGYIGARSLLHPELQIPASLCHADLLRKRKVENYGQWTPEIRRSAFSNRYIPRTCHFVSSILSSNSSL